MATFDYIHRFRANDGEGIDPDDVNDRAALMRRVLWTDFFGLVGTEPWVRSALPLADPVCRPFGDALLPVHVPATKTVRVMDGGVFFAPAADPGTPAQHALFHRLGAEVTGTSDVVTTSDGDPVFDRNDILWARVTEVTDVVGDNVSRDFQDEVTRALTTQPATNKRYRTQLELDVTEGTPGALPVDPAIPADAVPIARYVMRNLATQYEAADITDLRTTDIWPNPTGVVALTNPNIPIASVEEFTPEIWFGGTEATTYVSRSGRLTRTIVKGLQILLAHVSIEWTGGVVATPVEVRGFPFSVTDLGYNGPFGTHITLAHSYPQLSGNIVRMKDETGANVTGTATGTLNISFTAER